MSTIRQILAESQKRADIDEFLQKAIDKAGYGGMEISKTPLGTRVTVYVVRPGLVIGRGGESIRSLSKILEEKYKLFNPQIAVGEVAVPELNPYIMASKIASALERGVHFRRACYWALNGIMNAGALGAEITISGKLTTERARREKVKAGYIPKVGDPVMREIKKAVVSKQLKPGLFGIQVIIIPPSYTSPDRVEVKELPLTEGTPAEEAKQPAITPEEVKEKAEVTTEKSAEQSASSEAAHVQETDKDVLKDEEAVETGHPKRAAPKESTPAEAK